MVKHCVTRRRLEVYITLGGYSYPAPLSADIAATVEGIFEMKLGYIGTVLVLLVAIYFLFRLGYALATRYFNDPVFPWLGTLIFTFLGWKELDGDNPIGFLGFIPVCTYIFLRMANGLSWETTIKKRAQAVGLSAGASVAVYVITHHAFGFGVTEASLGAFVAAGILGLAGYTA